MFLFYDCVKQNEKNANYHKGVLFEKLLSEYLSKNGYAVQIRAKHNSLEYDLEGTDKTTQLNIVGEAKAFQDSISGQILSAFAGKLMGLGLFEKKIHGLFLSASPLTPEAKDYFDTIKGFGISCYTGDDLFNRIIESFGMPITEQVYNKTRELGYNPLFDFILTTNYGYAKLVIASNGSAMTPSCYLVFDASLNLVSDKEFLKKIENIKELRGFVFVCGVESRNTSVNYREIQRGLIIGKDWTDYRLPAAPEFFVGRKSLVKQIMDYIMTNQTESNVIQIKSRSGVGKSSILALLSDELNKNGCLVELHDARDIKSTVDVFSVIGRFTNTNNLPQNFLEVEGLLKEMIKTNKTYVFMVDQFESTFLQPDIFTSYETMAKIVCSVNQNVYFCLARKNDQLTTYDDSLISLNQLNSLSKNYELSDFSKEEARELLDKINENNSKKISKDVLSYILEFAQGFPWLLKRTMFHIIKLTSNISQKQLINTGLMLDDLFDEELDGLEEIEKEYLAKICAKLPADVNQLQISFEEDTLLPKMLDKFTQVRLLRLSGSTYDTYNDVFKEYLVYQKLPEFKHKHIFKQYPNSTMQFFAKIVNRNKFTLSQLSKNMKTSERSLANYIKECRNLGLLKKDDDYWVIPKNIKDMYLQGHLGMQIRRQVLNNELVSLVVKQISTKSICYEELTQIIRMNSPYVEASDATWNLYANALIAWLIATRIATRDKQSNISLENNSKVDLGEALGNMINSSYGKRGRASNREMFLPSTSWKYYELLFEMIKNNETQFDGETKKAYVDLNNSGIIDRLNNCEGVQDFREMMIQDYFSTDEYNKIWQAARENRDILTSVAELVKSEMTQSTLAWRSKRIINCGKELSILENKRYRHSGAKSK
ncbi:MAG: restriction endonuclease [Defluviitaleaceae bacterium]|nr:restriction endonuclease [Defluviitaleaceae bacterium]